jgi:hypothetical protein
MSRIQQLLESVDSYFLRHQTPAEVAFFDGKPMVVSEYSKDPDAKIGYADGRMRRGYKLHGFVTRDGWIAGFAIHSLNVGEPNTARSLLDAIIPGTLVLADGNYDSGPLYQAIADRKSMLLTRLRSKARSEKQMEQIMKSYSEMQDKYKDLIRLIEENPELMNYVEEKLKENNKKKTNL